VVAYWQTASRMIARLAGGPSLEWGPMLVKDGRIYLPNGAWLDYTTLEYDTAWQGDPRAAWKIKNRQGWTKLYGGKLVENVVQALARVVLSQAMLRIADLGYKIATCTHDEIVVVVSKDENPEDDYFTCKAEMETPPAWLPGLPLKVEGGVSERYEK
jgi:DNA polymerase